MTLLLAYWFYVYKTSECQIYATSQRFSKQNSICSWFNFALVIMTCVCMFYPGKFDLFEHGILFFVFHIIGDIPLFAQ